MNLSMYTYFSSMIRHEGAETAIAFARAHGFSSVEFLEWMPNERPLTVPDLHTAQEIRALLEQNGLSTSCFSVGIDLLDPKTGEEIPGSVEALMRVAEIAAAVGSPYLHHTLILNISPALHEKNLPFDALLDRLANSARTVAKRANELGLTVLYEPQGFYINGIDQFGKFYARMKAAGVNVGVCGDIGNALFADVDPTDFFQAYATEIRHVHLKDYRVETYTPQCKHQSLGKKGLRQVLLGDGDIDLAACIDSLRAVGYAGAYALEGSYEDIEEGFAKELSVARKILQST